MSRKRNGAAPLIAPNCAGGGRCSRRRCAAMGSPTGSSRLVHRFGGTGLHPPRQEIRPAPEAHRPPARAARWQPAVHPPSWAWAEPMATAHRRSPSAASLGRLGDRAGDRTRRYGTADPRGQNRRRARASRCTEAVARGRCRACARLPAPGLQPSCAARSSRRRDHPRIRWSAALAAWSERPLRAASLHRVDDGDRAPSGRGVRGHERRW